MDIHFPALFFGVVVSRRVLVKYNLVNRKKTYLMNKLNNIGFCIGLLTFAAVLMIAYFPSPTPLSSKKWDSAVYIHYTGIYCLYLFGACYMCIQPLISYLAFYGKSQWTVIKTLLFFFNVICVTFSSVYLISIILPTPIPYLEPSVAFSGVTEDDFPLDKVITFLMGSFVCLVLIMFSDEAESLYINRIAAEAPKGNNKV